MRMGMRVATAALCAAAALGACDRAGGGGGGGAAKSQAEAREDSSGAAAKALQDSGVSVDTQTIDTGTARTTPADDN